MAWPSPKMDPRPQRISSADCTLNLASLAPLRRTPGILRVTALPPGSGLALRTYPFAVPTCNLPRHATAGFHPRGHGTELAGASRSIPYASQRSTHAHLYARRHARRGQGAASRGSARERRPSTACQYLSFTSAPRRRDFREVRGLSRLHDLPPFGPSRPRRLPKILAAGPPPHVGEY